MVPEAQGEQYEVPQMVSALLLPRCKRLARGSANIKHIHADMPAIISRIAGKAGFKSCHDQLLQGLHEFADVKIKHAFQSQCFLPRRDKPEGQGHGTNKLYTLVLLLMSSRSQWLEYVCKILFLCSSEQHRQR